jgi:hypothetical protein
MKHFRQFIDEMKTISYPAAKSHKVYNKGKVTNIPSGKAVPINTSSGDDGGNGD